MVDSDENTVLDASTAPTTPEGSLSFSPVLRPLHNADGLDDDAAGSRATSRSISSTLLSSAAHNAPVRNICCVGAGYVGMSPSKQPPPL